jgi:FkbM family methyltransferase
MPLASLSPKVFIKSRPRLFDVVIHRVKRGLLGRRGPVFDVLDAFSRARHGHISFVQIGANDGLRNDPLREFIVRDDWNGVFVEPLPPVFSLLRRNYAYLAGQRKLAFENAAISNTDSTLAFYTIADSVLQTLPLEAQLDLLRKSSFSREHVAQFVSRPEDVVRVEVPCTTVNALIQKHFPDNAVDLLAIDAEGHESVILHSIDFAQSRIGAILFEAHHLEAERQRIDDLLTRNGYRVHQAGGDAFAVKE